MFPSEFRPLRGLAVFPVALMALALAGCASTGGLSPEGQPIDPDSLSARHSLAGALSDAAFPRKDWWKAFGDPQLDSLIGEALAGSPGLDAADARARHALAQAGLANAARQPTAAVGAQYSVIQLPGSIVPEPLGGDMHGSTVLTLNLKYSPDLWGGQRARWQAALGQARAAEVEAQAARLTLASNIVRTYATLAQAFALQDVAQAEQLRASALLELGRQRAEAGIDNQLPVRQAQSALASAQQQAQAAQQEIDAARNALAALLGQGPDRGLAIERPQLLQAPAPAVPAVLPSELLGHRADVVAARWQVEAASRGIDVSRAAFYPTINLSGIVGLVAGDLADLFSNDALLVQGGPALSLPIFAGDRLRSQLAGSQADYDLAVANYNQTLVGALREVADSLQGARSLDRQIAAATEARDAAAEAWELARTRYEAGLGTRIAVLTAQQPLHQLDQRLAALRTRRLATAVDLDRALGGGLELPAPPASTSDIAKAPTP